MKKEPIAYFGDEKITPALLMREGASPADFDCPYGYWNVPGCKSQVPYGSAVYWLASGG